MKQVPLTRGRVAYVSDIDYPQVRKRKWYCSSNKGRYAQTWNHGKPILLHQFIMELRGIIVENQIDHKNGDTYNNTRSNLRVATNQQNQMNRKVVLAKSGVKGVYPNTGGRWQARLMLDQKIINLGTYGTIREAAQARHKGELKYYGKFANSRREA